MKIRLFTIPNLITLAGLACGCAAIVYILGQGDLVTAFWLVAAAAVLDFLDGFAARLLKSYSEVGKQLDSLSDMVSFGVAPSAVLFYIYASSGGEPLWGFSVFVLALFSALRLAKFNVDQTQSDSFVGLPTPASALLVASVGWLFMKTEMFVIQPWYVIAVAACLAVLLISPVRMFSLKFKGFSLKGNQVRYLFLLVALISLLAAGIAAIPFIILAYVLVSAVLSVVCRNYRAKAV